MIKLYNYYLTILNTKDNTRSIKYTLQAIFYHQLKKKSNSLKLQ